MSRTRTTWLGCVLVIASFACDRDLKLRSDPKTFPLPSTPGSEDLEPVETDLGTSAHPMCDVRPVGECAGPVDFPCGFDAWVHASAAECQVATDCRTNGTLAVEMDAGGCVTGILMDQPNEAVVACLVERFGDVRCPCGEADASYYFGVGNDGCDEGPPPG